MIDTFYTIDTCPLKIALLADLHARPFDDVLRSLDANRPDIICIAGDIVYGIVPEDGRLKMEESGTSLRFLKECAARRDTFLSLGNHEWMLCEEDRRMIRDTGVILLDDTFVRRGDLCIGGLSSGRVFRYKRFREETAPRGRYPEMRDMNRKLKNSVPDTGWLDEFEAQKGYRILLSHHPEYYEKYLKDRDIDLILSGHVHGGQIRLFGRGVFSRDQGLFPKYCQGIHDGRFVISRGLANTFRIPRWFNEPEVVYISSEGRG